MFWKKKPVFERTPIPEPKDFRGWSQRFMDRAADFPEEQNNVDFKFHAPTTIALIADLHIGTPHTDYERIEKEAKKIVHTKNMFCVLAGDLINHMNWNPGQFEESEQTPEQIAYLRAYLDYLARDDKLLHSIGGDHEGWLMKQGVDINHEMNHRWGASFSKGPTYFNVKVGKKVWKLSGCHALPGHSIYNVNHPQMRAVRFGSMHGSDVIFSGHNHKKGIAMSFQHELGEPQRTYYIALGPYKATDSWLAKKGWATQKALEMGGVAVKFGTKKITVFENILDA